MTSGHPLYPGFPRIKKSLYYITNQAFSGLPLQTPVKGLANSGLFILKLVQPKPVLSHGLLILKTSSQPLLEKGNKSNNLIRYKLGTEKTKNKYPDVVNDTAKV